jgi:hypothetical protein
VSRVFISYSHQDEDSARTLKHALVGHGHDVWLAADEIRAGDSFTDRMRDGMRSAEVVVLLIGQHPSPLARNEWSRALQRSWDTEGEVALVPVVLDDAEIPTFLHDQQHVRIQEDTAGWEPLAEMLGTVRPTAFEWRTPDTGRTELANRLNELEKIAAALPDDSDAAR